MNNILNKVYDTVSKNLEGNADKSLPFQEEAINFHISEAGEPFNLAKANILSENSFGLCAFLGVLGRHPSDFTGAIFSEEIGKIPKEKYQQQIMTHLIKSNEFTLGYNSVIDSHLVFDEDMNKIYASFRPNFKQKIKGVVLRIYAKFPSGLKSFIKGSYYKLRGWK